MALTERLALLVSADVKGAVRGLGDVGKAADKNLSKAEKGIDKWGRGLKTAGIGMAAFGVAALVGLGKAAQASEDANLQVVKLQNSMANNPKLAGQSTKAFTDLADAIQDKTAADGDAIVGGEAVLAHFGLEAKQIKELTPLVVDLARKRGIDMVQAATLAAKASDGNVGALKRMGIQVDETLAKTDAYKATVEALRGAVGGFAEEEGRTFAGSLERMKNQLGDLVEGVGAGAVDAFSDMIGVVDPLIDKFNDLDPAVQGTVGKFAAFGAAGLVAAGGASFLIGKVITMRENFRIAKDGIGSFVGSLKDMKGKLAVGAVGVGLLAAVLVTMAQKSKQAREEAKALRDEAEATGKTIEEVARGQLAENVAVNERLSDSLDTLGMSLEDFNRLTGLSKGEIEAWADEQLAAARGNDVQQRALFAVRDALVEYRGKVGMAESQDRKATEAKSALGVATEDAAANTADLGDEIEDTGKKAETAAERIDRITSAIGDYYDEATAATRGSIDFEGALDDLTEQIATNSGTLDLNTEAGRRNAEAALTVGDRIIALANKRVEETGSVEAGRKAAESMVARLRDEMTQRGYSKTAIDKYVAAIKLTPKDIRTTFTVDTWSATQAVKAFFGELQAVASYAGLSQAEALAALQVDLAKAETGKPKALGGPVMAGSAYLVGEKGPELFVPNSSGTIIPNASGTGTTAGGTNIIIYMPPGSDGEDVVEAIRRYERRNGDGWRN